MFLRKILLIISITLFSLTVFGYGLYKALPIIIGPKVEIITPKNGEIVEGTSIEVRGNVSRAKALYINHIPTAFTETGSFVTRFALYPGSNILIVDVEDRFGRVVTETINIGTK